MYYGTLCREPRGDNVVVEWEGSGEMAGFLERSSDLIGDDCVRHAIL